ncbi:MAG: xanthan lyase [Bacteroides sp.]|nr:xanthan lyase [Bacteroides sp.]
MNVRKYIGLLIVAVMASLAFIVPEAEAAHAAKVKAKTSKTATSKKKRNTAKSSAGASKKRTSSSKKGATASKKKNNASGTSKKKSSSKSRTRKSTSVKRTVAPTPVERPSDDPLTLSVNAALLEWLPKEMNPGGLRVNRVNPNMRQGTVGVSLNENYTYMPVTRDLISDMTKVVRRTLPDSLSNFNITLNVGARNLAYYISKIDKLPSQYRQNVPFVTAVNPWIHPRKGMEGDIIALWHSHGRYFKGGGWQWQRGFLFQSLEDTYTMGYVLPFLVPMLENAGAYVMLPRERDMSRHEVIVDNDTNEGGMLFSQTSYVEKNGTRKWVTGEGDGFIYDLPDFRDTENPFENGTYRQVETVRSGNPSVAAWYADIPEDGEYAVYVSYKSLPNSTEDARYTVNYSGGSKDFKVNQTMGGGTWIYLGTFPLEEGYSDKVPVVTLTNVSDKGGQILTADAVKIGGGMGNIARSSNRSDIYYDPSTPLSESALAAVTVENDQDDESMDDSYSGDDEDDENDAEDEEEDEDIDAASAPLPASSQPVRPSRIPSFSTSGMPRYLEGARYWLHWAGFPEKVYSPFHGTDDYKDDYTCRGHWVNYLAGGSRVLPGREGLRIPVDISFALHSDAGKRADDTTVGTLGIYYTNNGANYVDGTPRSNSRNLTNMLMTQITSDIRRTYEPNWTRRSMWDKSYLEARVAEVPTTLIEILSHQNFRDMQYGLDPNFRFVVSRAIYKAMARFVSERKDREVVIQPLPVREFAITPQKGKKQFRLSWMPTYDPLEPTANPNKYIILERTEGNLGFVKVGETASTHFDVRVEDDLIHSFRVIAANEGGVAFPSETLSLRYNPSSPTVMVVNGFDRVSAPSHFSEDGRAGFNAEDDFGVAYISDGSFAGYQTEFRRNAGEGFGRSNSNGIGKVIAGNSFDYPAVHGDGIADAGYGFVSASAAAVEAGKVELSHYPVVDLILGKQKCTAVGRGTSGVRYQALPNSLTAALEKYVFGGGSLIVSGAYVVSDATETSGNEEAKQFTREVLGVTYDRTASRTRSGKLSTYGSVLGNSTLSYSNDLNKAQYIVEKPDALQPVYSGAETVLTFSDTGSAAGILSSYGKGKTLTLSVPIESIKGDDERNSAIASFLRMVSK